MAHRKGRPPRRQALLPESSRVPGLSAHSVPPENKAGDRSSIHFSRTHRLLSLRVQMQRDSIPKGTLGPHHKTNLGHQLKYELHLRLVQGAEVIGGATQDGRFLGAPGWLVFKLSQS
jgi:hypothetical protein